MSDDVLYVGSDRKDTSDVRFHPDDLADWFRLVLAELEGRDGDEIAEGYNDVFDRPLTVAQVRENMRGGLTRLAVDKYERRRRAT